MLLCISKEVDEREEAGGDNKRSAGDSRKKYQHTDGRIPGARELDQ
jgi:hypothetical protein